MKRISFLMATGILASSPAFAEYNVAYEYQGETYTTQMPSHPNDRIKIKISVSPVSGASESSRYSY